MTNHKNIKNAKIKPTIYIHDKSNISSNQNNDKTNNLDEKCNKNSYKNDNIIIEMMII